MNDLVLPEMLDVGLRFNPRFPSIPLRVPVDEMLGRTVFLDPRRVMPYVGQPRTKFTGITGLAGSITKTGQKTTILVFPVRHPQYDAMLIEGERRTKACIAAGLMIRAEIRPNPKSKEEHFVDSFVANYDREGLTSLETVHAVAKLIGDGHTLQDIAEMTGMTISWASQYASLSKLHADVLRFLDEDSGQQRDPETGRKLRRKTVLPLNIALLLTHVAVHDEQKMLAGRIVEGRLSIGKARALIDGHLTAKGEVLRSRRKSPAELFGFLERGLRKYFASLDTVLDMSQGELRSLVGNQLPADRAQLAEQMRGLSDQLSGLANEIWRKES